MHINKQEFVKLVIQSFQIRLAPRPTPLDFYFQYGHYIINKIY